MSNIANFCGCMYCLGCLAVSVLCRPDQVCFPFAACTQRTQSLLSSVWMETLIDSSAKLSCVQSVRSFTEASDDNVS